MRKILTVAGVLFLAGCANKITIKTSYQNALTENDKRTIETTLDLYGNSWTVLKSYERAVKFIDDELLKKK